MFAEIAQNCVEIDVATFGWDPDDCDSGTFKCASFRRIERLRGENRDVAVRRI